MVCPPVFALLAMCTATPEPPPAALPMVAEPAATSCMTKEQARIVYKTSHLYWHGSRHCWDNSRGTVRLRAPVNKRSPKQNSDEVALVADANGNAAPPPPGKIEIYYPALLRAQAEIASDLYSMQRPITDWPLMLDIDITGPDLEKGIDGCCWPAMETLR
jgi:hypothetical protein